VKTRIPARTTPDLTTLRLIHRAMVRDADRIATAAATLADHPDPRASRALEWFGNNYLALLRHHHYSKDDVVWPLILASAGDIVDLTSLTEEHRTLNELITTIQGVLKDPADASAARTLVIATARLRTELADHLVVEDRDVLPVIERFVSIRDLNKADRRIQRTAPLHAVLFLVAWLDAHAGPNERHAVPLRFLLPLARRRYQRRARRAGLIPAP
jgi:iron-sulfur cluster repair protein YtfE (RIC family)